MLIVPCSSDYVFGNVLVGVGIRRLLGRLLGRRVSWARCRNIRGRESNPDRWDPTSACPWGPLSAPRRVSGCGVTRSLRRLAHPRTSAVGSCEGALLGLSVGSSVGLSVRTHLHLLFFGLHRGVIRPPIPGWVCSWGRRTPGS